MLRRKGLSFRRKNRAWVWILAALAAIAALACLFIFIFVPLMNERNVIQERESRLAQEADVSTDESVAGEPTTGYDGTFKIAEDDDGEGGTEDVTLLTTTEEETTTTLSEEELLDIETRKIISEMTLEQKVYQLFIVTPEDITGESIVTSADESLKEALEEHPVGGLVYYRQNFTDTENTKAFLKTTYDYAFETEGFPIFLMVTENGGTSGRVGGYSEFDIESHGSMVYVEDVDKARSLGEYIAGYLSDLGFNVDLAPNTAGLSTELVKACGEGLMNGGVLCCYRNFPGDNTGTLTAYEGHPYSKEGFEELKAGNMAPFMSMDAEEVPFVMASHICIPYITNDRVPTCLSEIMINDVLKGRLGYNGIIITSTLCNEAVRNAWGYENSCYLALKAGCDMIFEPTNLESSVSTIIEHINAGDLTESRIEESLYKIIKLKLKMEK